MWGELRRVTFPFTRVPEAKQKIHLWSLNLREIGERVCTMLVYPLSYNVRFAQKKTDPKPYKPYP